MYLCRVHNWNLQRKLKFDLKSCHILEYQNEDSTSHAAPKRSLELTDTLSAAAHNPIHVYTIYRNTHMHNNKRKLQDVRVPCLGKYQSQLGKSLPRHMIWPSCRSSTQPININRNSISISTSSSKQKSANFAIVPAIPCKLSLPIIDQLRLENF